jgi:RNA recognition motif-containing protein
MSTNGADLTKATVFVRGLPKSATDEQLTDFFSSVGPVKNCFIVCDAKTRGPQLHLNIISIFLYFYILYYLYIYIYYLYIYIYYLYIISILFLF